MKEVTLKKGQIKMSKRKKIRIVKKENYNRKRNKKKRE